MLEHKGKRYLFLITRNKTSENKDWKAALALLPESLSVEKHLVRVFRRNVSWVNSHA